VTLSLNGGAIMPTTKRELISAEKPEPRFGMLGLDEDISVHTLNNHIGFVKQLSASINPNDLCKRLQKALKTLGFSDFALMNLSQNQDSNFTLSSLPAELTTCYQKQHVYAYDMALDYLKTGNLKHIDSSVIEKFINNSLIQTHTFDVNREIKALYEKFDFNDIYMMPIKLDRFDSESMERMMFCIMAKGVSHKKFKKLTKANGDAAYLLGDAAELLHQSKFTDRTPKPKIDPRPVRLLVVMAKADVTLSQAADKLSISLHTANKYMAMAKKMLGTRSQANTIYKAVQQGLIDIHR
jgi:DNA-binding NarL/FixJ family response regulator